MSIRMKERFSSGDRKPQSVRRCLFGKTDTANLEQEYQALIEADTKRFSERWGLDPKSGIPVDGSDYICSPVDLCKETIPEFYLKGYAPRKSRPVERCSESWRGPYNRFVFPEHPAHARRNAKRRLHLDDDQENKKIAFDLPPQFVQAVVRPTEAVAPADISAALSSLTVPCSSSVGSTTGPAPSDKRKPPSSLDSSLSNKSSGLLDRVSISTPNSIAADHSTPKTQTFMKDYFPIQKKRRTVSTKL